ncbi:MAG: cation diffusion facilitator family transporter [Candidatus ainarchaeum sp.]|nr:cation diffusion facilitator family transporter [Candidatus ainarchaeum sp.]
MSFSKVGLISNIFLFIIKGYVGILSGSLALLSDAINSFTDILASIGILIAVKEGEKRKDSDHPYGHHAAEPLSAFVVSILAAILAFEILRSAIEGIIFPRTLTIDIFVFLVIIITMVTKLLLLIYFKSIEKKNKGQAVQAYILDSRNDILISGVVFLGVFFTYFDYPIFDSISAILVSLYIFKTAFDLGKKNVNFLMGGAPDRKKINEIKSTASSLKEIKEIKSIKAHYFGDTLHVHIIATVNRNLSLIKVHKIEENLISKIHSIKDVSEVSVHMEPD